MILQSRSSWLYIKSYDLKKSNGSNWKFVELSIIDKSSFGFLEKINGLIDEAFSSFLIISYPLL